MPRLTDVETFNDVSPESALRLLLADRAGVIAPFHVSLAQETMAVIQQNQRWALLYNVVAMPLAALGFVPPWLAALGMSFSSLCVIGNALRIGRDPASVEAQARQPLHAPAGAA